MAIESRLTDIFIDGLNFYNAAVKDSPYRWLDFRRMAENVLPEHTIGRIYYFTAIVLGRPPDRPEPIRQVVYMRALSTIPGLEIHYGSFRSEKRKMPAAGSPGDTPNLLEVVRVEEKQTDVNLTTHLVARAVNHDYEQAALISADTHFVGAIRYVRDTVGIPVVVLNPNVMRGRGLSRGLQGAATYVRNIREEHLAQSQLPDQLTDQHGTITKPAIW